MVQPRREVPQEALLHSTTPERRLWGAGGGPLCPANSNGMRGNVQVED